MSEADILKPTASQSLNTIVDFQTRERRAEEENKPICVSRFYEGSIASFDYFEKKHNVNYDDGDVEDLDLLIERWELIRDVKSAVDAQDAYVELPVVKQEVEKRKVIRIKPTHQRVRDAAAELPVGEEGEKPKNKRRRTKKATPRFPVLDSKKVNIKGYQVKTSAAPILEEIFEKHCDISANCPYPSRGFRASVFEVICDVIRQLRTNDWGTIVSMVGQMRTEVSDTAAAAHLEVSWLKQILDDIPTEDDGQLACVIRNTALSKRTAERAVEVRESVKKAQNDMELNFNKRNDLQNRVRENNGIVRVPCEDSGKELFAEKSQWCRSE
nr:phospholipase-like protein [Ipomoea batatas]